MASKNTSARGVGTGRRLLSGTRAQLIKDLQHVHKLFPTAVPDRDFYRKHGNFADTAWKEHFPRFKDFVAAARPTLPPFAAACRHLEQAARLLKQHGKNLSDDELREINGSLFGKVEWLNQELEDFTSRMTDEILAEMAEAERIEAEENEKSLRQPKSN